eukprot:1458379-Prorocentrum_lima.AAC.1
MSICGHEGGVMLRSCCQLSYGCSARGRRARRRAPWVTVVWCGWLMVGRGVVGGGVAEPIGLPRVR